ncbi:Hypothetical predicted protein [Mytilus galloprovincialis]|uniref:Uncharacterized protein n=1 Tax=Mytilus galloprovincialis TaxID=29158 RepID=A0A8B6EQJ1_MYTGA|nr:Hypothetical predicted protein [Mytilus galloprovincialis]
MVPDLLVKKHGAKAYSVSQKSNLYNPCLKSLEKLAYQGQVAARMGKLLQHTPNKLLGNLLNTLSENEVNLDKSIQLVRDIFAMSTKSLDQVARAGAFHHLIRRKSYFRGHSLNDIKELKHPLVSLPLTKSGVIGDNMEQTLKDRVDKNKQLKELLPELHVNKTFSVKRKATGNQFSNDWSKKPKFDNAQGSTFTGAKSNTQRTVQRTSTVTRPDKDDKSSGTTNNFRRFNNPFHPRGNKRNDYQIKVKQLSCANVASRDTSLPFVQHQLLEFYQSSIGSSCTFTSTSIRLVVYLTTVSSKSIISHVSPGSRDSVESSGKVGFHNQSKKILFNSNTENNTYIGALFHLDLGIVMPTQERVLKLQKTVKVMSLKKHATARDFLHLLGIMASCIEMIPYARLHMRPIQIYLLSHWRPTFSKSGTECSNYTISKISSDLVVRYSQHYKGQIFTTLGNSCDHNDRCFYIERLGWSHGFPDSPRDLVRYTENSTYQLSRVGSCTENNTTFSPSVEKEKCTSAMRQLDCCTIHKQTGGTKSIQLCQKNLDLLKLLIEHKIQIKAAHIAGKANVLADLYHGQK